MRKWLGIVCLFFWPFVTVYANPIYPFATPAAETRFTALLSELRCLVCQNQSLAESNATLAQDLRDQIYQQIQAGQSDEDIRHYLTQRYGNFILYRPPWMISTYILWIAPFICLFAGLFFLIFFVKNQKEG